MEATDGLAGVRTVRPIGGAAGSSMAVPEQHDAEFAFWFVLEGAAKLEVGGVVEALSGGDSVVVPSATEYRWIEASSELELLEVTLPAAPTFSPATAGG